MSNDTVDAVMTRPARTPIGLELARSARIVGRAFDEALSGAGGSLPVWLVLLNLKMGANATQRELAESVGVTEATLTHHLNAMEAGGLLTRRREPANRRVQVVEPTAAGEELFLRLREAAVAFDRRLRRGIPAGRLAELEALLGQLVANVGG
jgi:MarR family transcriptional regulator, transcriptional regulator for hemolysin